MTRDEIIQAYMPLARIRARQMHRRIHYLGEFDDLLSESYIGLIKAVDSWKPDSGAALRTWINHKTWNAMLDYLRELDCLKRGHRKQVGSAFQPTEGDDIFPLIEDAAPTPEMRTIQSELVRLALDPERSSPRQAWLLQKHFLEEITQEELGAQMGIVPSRVSQLISSAKVSIRQSMAA